MKPLVGKRSDVSRLKMVATPRSDHQNGPLRWCAGWLGPSVISERANARRVVLIVVTLARWEKLLGKPVQLSVLCVIFSFLVSNFLPHYMAAIE